MSDLRTDPRAVLASALGRATALRGSRVFHPRGQSYTARLTVSGLDKAGPGWGANVLDRPAGHDGIVRLSRAIGLPSSLPDVEGLALRLPGHGVDGAPLDLLINSAWRFLFVPSVLAPTWSSMLPYRTGSGRLVLLGARPVAGGFSMLAASPLGRWQPWAHLELGQPFDGEALRFAPTVGATDLVPVPLFRSLRAASYGASQDART